MTIHTPLPILTGRTIVPWVYETAEPDPGLSRWLQARGVNLNIAVELAAPLCEFPIIRFPFSREFQFAECDEPGAVPAIVHAAAAEDGGIIPAGLVAWLRDQPNDVYWLPGGIAALGLDQLHNPASYYGGQPLQVHRTPRQWLAGGCSGIVPLDFDALWRSLFDLPDCHHSYALAAENVAHGRALRAALDPLPPYVRLVVPHRGAS
jgi:hypothetical protein